MKAGKQLVVLDIEAMENIYWSKDQPKLHDFQKELFKGFSAGQLSVIAAGRGTGKSAIWDYHSMKTHKIFLGKPIKELATAEVDGMMWHTVECNTEPSRWLRTQKPEQWYEHSDARWPFTTFDISDRLYTFMRIKFST